METNGNKKILIIGGGFGGIRCALDLAERNIPNTKIILVSDKPHFEYHAALYRVVTGKSPLEVCIPINEIFKNKNVEFVVDTITAIDPVKKTAVGSSGSLYRGDYLVLALGSETAYFNVPGLQQFSFGFKSITEALRLKQHLHESFMTCAVTPGDTVEDLCRMHFVVVGAGPSGVELAGEPAGDTKKLAKIHNVTESLITIDLIDGAPTILPTFPARVRERVAERLRMLGVNIFTNRPIVEEKGEEVIMRGLDIQTRTVIWTAGVTPNGLYQKIPGLSFDKKKHVEVDEYLRAKGFTDVFAVGDGASTPFSGMAQTAMHDGATAAHNIMRALRGNSLQKYVPQKPYYALPVGAGWAATYVRGITFYGSLGWLFRRLADLRFFLSILPWRKALSVFRNGKTLCESCAVCIPEGS